MPTPPPPHRDAEELPGEVWVGEQRGRVAPVHDLAGVEDHDRVGDAPDEREVLLDEQDRRGPATRRARRRPR